ncbi:MAG: NlpC/P60 family protein [Caulobacterales bacterium]|nr:NlpC/P60 family protein [Caulobacterales bacterium]
MSGEGSDPRWPVLAGDPRIDPFAGDGPAEPGAAPRRLLCSDGVTALRRAPSAGAEMMSALRFGVAFNIYHQEGGWAFGQAGDDDYVGYVQTAALSEPHPEPTAKVTALRTIVFSEPDTRSAPVFFASLGSRFAEERREGRFVRVARGGWAFEGHLAPLHAWEADWVGVAERFLGAPYLWGGKDSIGLDCSGLVQLALEAGGVDAPRDTDMQEKALGAPIEAGDGYAGLRRGDLVFWNSHCGAMVDAERIIHANAHHMEVAIEPLAEAADRLSAHVGPITSVRRIARRG